MFYYILYYIFYICLIIISMIITSFCYICHGYSLRYRAPSGRRRWSPWPCSWNLGQKRGLVSLKNVGRNRWRSHRNNGYPGNRWRKPKQHESTFLFCWLSRLSRTSTDYVPLCFYSRNHKSKLETNYQWQGTYNSILCFQMCLRWNSEIHE